MKIKNLKAALESVEESRESEESAGDEMETGRAMAEVELEHIQQQLKQVQNQKDELLRISRVTSPNKAGFGTLIITTNGNYLMGLGLGAVKFDSTTFFCVSTLSPIGELLNDKQVGDKITFRENTFTIEEIL